MAGEQRVLARHLLVKRLLVAFALVNCAPTPPDVSKYPPPAESCTPDAGADADVTCAPPTSGCADEHWLYYYDDGQCEQGQCSWETKFFYCDDRCVGGGQGGCYNAGSTAPYYGP